MIKTKVLHKFFLFFKCEARVLCKTINTLFKKNYLYTIKTNYELKYVDQMQTFNFEN